MSRIGQRLSTTAPRYIKHPAAASAWVQDARFIDAGTAMMIDNNLSHLSHESLRQLAAMSGPGSLTASQNGTWVTAIGTRAYDDVEPTTTAASHPIKATLIAWDARVSRRIGPIVAIQDRLLATGGYGPRKIRVYARCELSAGTMHVLAAMTPTESPPNTGTLVFAGELVAGTSTVDIDLECPSTIQPVSPWTARPSTGRGAVSHPVAEFYVWIGWCLHAGGSGAIRSISVLEMPSD